MFLLEDIHNNILLREAPEDEVREDIHEPTEEDAEIQADKDREDEASESGGEETVDEEDTGDDMGDEDDEGGFGGEEEPQMSPEESLRKYNLLHDYETLLRVTEDLRDSIKRIDTSDFTEKENQIFSQLDKMLAENINKLEFVILKVFKTFEYERLLTIYIYLKSSLNIISEIVEKAIKTGNK